MEDWHACYYGILFMDILYRFTTVFGMAIHFILLNGVGTKVSKSTAALSISGELTFRSQS